MATESIISLRGFAKIALALLLFSVCLSQGAAGQATLPSVVPSVVNGLTPPSTWGAVWETAISSQGDFLVFDFENDALYQYPPNGGAVITLFAPGAAAPGGQWSNYGIAVDKYDNLYIDNNWNGGLQLIPYDPVHHTWNTAAVTVVASSTAAGYYQGAGLAANASGTIVMSDEDNGRLWSWTADALGNATNVQEIISAVSGRARSLTIDNFGNIYEYEDGGLSGVLMIPAGTTGLANDKSLVRVDPVSGGLPMLSKITGVAADAAGNLYIGDSVAGVFMVPYDSSISAPNPANWVMLTSLPAAAQVSLDQARDILYVPTSASFTSPSPFAGISDTAEVLFGGVALGSSAIGTPGSPVAIEYSFSNSVTPGSFVFQEDGVSTPDFATVGGGGTCAAGINQVAQTSCTLSVAVDPFSAGGVSAKLLMLDGSKNVLATTVVDGTGQGPALSVTPALQIPIGAGLMTPSEVATDAAGNVYVADAGLKEVLMYAKGSTAATVGVPVGTGLTAPTGVAVDGAGDVLIADSGNVIEVPYSQSLGGLNAPGQMTIKSGLGANLRLAADGLGNLYVADPDNARVVQLGNLGGALGILGQTENDITGFTAPSVVAVDESNNLYVIDGANLIEVQQPTGVQTTLLSTLSGVTGLAVDPTGAVYVSMNGGAERIPNVGGTLTQSAQTSVGPTVLNPTGLALDKAGNVYLADGTAEDLNLVSINGAVNVGSPSLGNEGTGTATLMNIGNSALTVTGFLSSDVVDFSATGCDTAVSSGETCAADVVMNPGPGIQGLINSTITIQSNAANSPVVVDASGTAAALANSTSTISVASTATVLNIPVTVTVASTSGTGPVPTGNVVVSVDGANPTTETLSNGTVTMNLTAITAGSHTFSVSYIGDRTYGASTASTTATLTQAAGVMVLPPPPPYSLSTLDGNEPYDNSLISYYTNYVVTITGAAGLPPTGTVTFMQGSAVMCGPLPVGGTASAPTPGQATFQPGCLAISINTNSPNELTPQTITSVVYSGDANYAGSTGGPLTFNELRQPSVAISPNPGAITLSAGTGSATLSITSVLGYGVSTNPAYPSSTPTLTLNNYTLPLGFTCQGLPAYSTCTFTGGNYTDLNGVLHPDEVVVDTDPSKPVSITVTINTNVSTGTTTTSQNSHSSPFEFAAMFGISLVGLAFGRKSGLKGRALMLICLLILTGAISGMTACSTTTLGGNPILTTPSGTYPVIVSAQQVGSAMVPGNNGTPVLLYGSTNVMSLPYTMNVTVQ